MMSDVYINIYFFEHLKKFSIEIHFVLVNCYFPVIFIFAAIIWIMTGGPRVKGRVHRAWEYVAGPQAFFNSCNMSQWSCKKLFTYSLCQKSNYKMDIISFCLSYLDILISSQFLYIQFVFNFSMKVLSFLIILESLQRQIQICGESYKFVGCKIKGLDYNWGNSYFETVW